MSDTTLIGGILTTVILIYSTLGILGVFFFPHWVHGWGRGRYKVFGMVNSGILAALALYAVWSFANDLYILRIGGAE